MSLETLLCPSLAQPSLVVSTHQSIWLSILVDRYSLSIEITVECWRSVMAWRSWEKSFRVREMECTARKEWLLIRRMVGCWWLITMYTGANVGFSSSRFYTNHFSRHTYN